jgi:integrase
MKFLDKQDKHGRWIYQYWDKSKQQSRYAHLGTADKKEALKRFKIKQAEELVYLRNPHAVKVSGSVYLSELAKEYIRLSKITIKSKLNYWNSVKNFINACKDKPIGMYGAKDWFIFLDHANNKGFAADTTATNAAHLRAIVNYAIKVKYIKESFIGEFSFKGKQEITVIPPDELRDFLIYCKIRNYKYYYYLMHTYTLALRPAEGLYLRWEYVNMESEEVKIINSKRARFDVIPMINDVKEFYLFHGYKDVGLIHGDIPTSQAVTLFFKRAVKAYEKDKKKKFPYTLNMLRKTRGTQLANAGVRPFDLMRFMRHRDFKTTEKYYVKIDLSDMKNRINEDLKTSKTTSRDSILTLINFNDYKDLTQ